MPSPKRFIAGAVCPRCAEMDKLTMYVDELQQQIRECVSCGYSDKMTEQGPEELPTRVNQARPGEQPLAHEDEVQVVNLMDPRKKPH
jgi:uncharacterized metal-binding protein (TIGR02443 family)